MVWGLETAYLLFILQKYQRCRKVRQFMYKCLSQYYYLQLHTLRKPVLIRKEKVTLHFLKNGNAVLYITSRNCVLNIFSNCLGWCCSEDWASAYEQKSHWFNSQSGHVPVLRAGSQLGVCKRQPVSVSLTCGCFSASFSLPPLSLKKWIIKIFKKIFSNLGKFSDCTVHGPKAGNLIIHIILLILNKFMWKTEWKEESSAHCWLVGNFKF